MRPITVVALRLTCGACPTQWEGRTDDGRHVYVRYRWGTLRVGVGASIEEAVADHATFSRTLGDGLDGRLSYPALVAATAPRFDWPIPVPPASGWV